MKLKLKIIINIPKDSLFKLLVLNAVFITVYHVKSVSKIFAWNWRKVKCMFLIIGCLGEHIFFSYIRFKCLCSSLDPFGRWYMDQPEWFRLKHPFERFTLITSTYTYTYGIGHCTSYRACTTKKRYLVRETLNRKSLSP